MDDFQRNLKRDAEAIEAKVDPALRRRIEAELEDARRTRAPAGRRPAPLLAWAGVTAGLAAAVLLVVSVNRAPEVEAPVAAVTPPAAGEPAIAGLRFETVSLTRPLEQELTLLRADLEKARNTIENDLRDSL